MTGFVIHPTAIIGGPPQHFKGYAETFPVELDLDHVAVGPFATIDRGTERPTRVGPGTQILGHTNIGHDVIIGHDCEIADSVVIAGHAELGDHVRVGVGAMILPHKKIGDHARIGAGAIVCADIPAYALAFGNPARIRGWFCPECGSKTSERNICAVCALEMAYA